MKKKLFTLITLLVAIVTGASAATTWTFRAADIKNGADFAPRGTNVFVADDSKELTYKGNADSDALVATAATIGGVSYSSYVNLNGATSSGRYMYVEGISGTGTLSIVFASGKSNNKKITINDNAYNGTEIASINSTEANLNGTKQDIEITTSLNAEHKYYINGQRSVYAVIWTPSATPAKDYTVTAASNNTSYGTAATSASSLDEGETATITATPKTGYEFTSWAVEGKGSTLSSTTTNPTTLTMGTANATVTATFSAINYTITHNAATGGTYTISVAGGDATDANTTATIGQTITLAGTPTDPAHTYVVWNVKDAGDKDVTVTNNQFTMPASNVTIAPVFSEPLNTLFSMTNITGIENNETDAHYGTVTATISEGASAEVYEKNGNASSLLYNSNLINLNGSGNNYIHITLPNNLVLKEGDVISAEGNGSIRWQLGKTSSASNKTCPYTLTGEDALIGATELYIKKKDGAQISSVTIQGSGTVSDFAITSSTTPEVAIDAESTITYTTSSTGDITFTSSDEGVARVSEAGVITGVGGGTATITITQDADATYRLGIAKITVTVPETAMIKVKLNGTSDATVTGTIDGVSAEKDGIENGGNKFGGGAYVTLILPTGYTFQTGDILNVKITANASGSGAIKVYDPANKDEEHVWFNTGTIGSVGDNKFILPSTVNGKQSISICRTSGNGWNAKVAYISVTRPDAVVTLNANGFATYSAGTDFEYVGADAYTMALDLSGEGSLTGTKITAGTKIPAGAGILFKGTAGAKVSIMNTTGASALAGTNNLHGTTDADGNTVDVPKGKTLFVLSGDTFKPYTGTTFAANKAFFQVNGTTVEARSFTMTFDDETTGINAVENTKPEVKDNVYYNLNGQRVNTPRKGLYIVNGKKVMVK